MSIVHQTISLHTGLRPHVISAYSETKPAKATVILLHGFPDTNYGWRHLIKPIARAGFDVFAPSMRGYGPHDAEFLKKDEDLRMELVCQDVDALLTALQVDKAVIVGHDWGGTIAWNFCCHYAHRTLAVASFCTPFFTVPAEFAYQVFFHSDEARVVLEADIEQTVRTIIRASTDEPVVGNDLEFQAKVFGLHKVTGITKEPSPSLTTSPPSKILTPSDIKVYVSQFNQSGFLNPIRWYRNVERNWQWNQGIKGKRVKMPALMVTAADDHILRPSMTDGMDKHCDQLKLVHIKEASHWIMQQQPEQCAKVLCDWLKELPISSLSSSSAKL